MPRNYSLQGEQRTTSGRFRLEARFVDGATQSLLWNRVGASLTSARFCRTETKFCGVDEHVFTRFHVYRVRRLGSRVGRNALPTVTISTYHTRKQTPLFVHEDTVASSHDQIQQYAQTFDRMRSCILPTQTETKSTTKTSSHRKTFPTGREAGQRSVAPFRSNVEPRYSSVATATQ